MNLLRVLSSPGILGNLCFRVPPEKFPLYRSILTISPSIPESSVRLCPSNEKTTYHQPKLVSTGRPPALLGAGVHGKPRPHRSPFQIPLVLWV